MAKAAWETGKRSHNPEKLIPKVVAAAIGATSFQQATRDMNEKEAASLSRALRMDVDKWRQEFAAKLRAAGEDLLELTHKELAEIPPAARAYTLAVLIDKASVLEGKTAMSGSQVNVQINNYGSVSKEDILAKLQGKFTPSAPASEVSEVSQPAEAGNISTPEFPG